MDVRQSIHSAHAKTLDTQGLRSEFLVEQVFEADRYTTSRMDRARRQKINETTFRFKDKHSVNAHNGVFNYI